MKKTVAILFGGESSEYAVSLRSAAAVIDNINRDKYDVIPIGITGDGDWYRYTGPAELLEKDEWWADRVHLVPVTVSLSRSEKGFFELRRGGLRRVPVDLVFPVLHGKNGEDGTVQGMLELAGLTVVGCGTLASALCMDKDRAHRLVRDTGIRVPAAVTFHVRDREEGERRVLDTLTFPVFVKPLRAGSSFGITRAAGESALPSAVDEAARYDDTVTVEQAVPGFEVGCAVIGRDRLITGRVDEIELAGGFFDFDNKYTDGSAVIHTPARVDRETETRVIRAAETIYRALDCSGFARVDMFLTPGGEVVFNEVNTIPGLTSHSRFPAMMRAAGIELPDALDLILGQYV